MEPLVIKEYLTAIKLDKDNKLLFAYDIKDKIIDKQSPCTITKRCKKVQELISYHLNRRPKNPPAELASASLSE